MKITVPVSATTLYAALWSSGDDVAVDNKQGSIFNVYIENLDANSIYVDWSWIAATTANWYRLDQNDKVDFQVSDLSQVSLIAGTEATDVRVFITS